MNNYVTAICMTYGRHKRLTEETIESFLRQDYPYKRLLIINTHPDPIRESWPQVEIQNIEDSFATYPEKQHYAITQVESEYFCMMDDDLEYLLMMEAQ